MIEATRENTNPGDVLQIDPRYQDGRCGLGLMVAEEIKGWGVQGFIAVPARECEGWTTLWSAEDDYCRIYLRVPWEFLHHVGSLYWVPGDVIGKAEEAEIVG